jgi:uncharacterized protein
MVRRKLRMPETAAIRNGFNEQGLIEVRVTPNASAEEITLPAGDSAHIVAIRTPATPEHGKANHAVLRLLAKALDLPVSSLALVRGGTGRNKLIRIFGRT